jgi:hypothetical protein
MDLNYLYHRHQVALFMSDNAACDQSRAAHLGLVAAYASKIAEMKLERAPLGLVANAPVMREQAPSRAEQRSIWQ